MTLAEKRNDDGGGLLGGKMVTVIGDTTGATQGAVDARRPSWSMSKTYLSSSAR